MRRRIAPGLLASAVLLAGCGGEAGSDEASTPEETSTAEETTPTASPTASPPAGGEGAAFVVLPTAPAEVRDLTGQVLLSEDRTALTLELTGLEPGEQYMGHVHANACENNAGGPHFKFDPAGGDEPPNEVHFTMATEQDGTATATATASQPLPDTARSVVVHTTGGQHQGTRLACADLPGAAAPDPTPTADAHEITLSYTGGQAGGDTGRVEVPLGEPIRLRITSDVADKVHVHGFDKYADLVPGQTAEIELAADMPGVFAVELHDAGTVLTRLQVR